MISKEAENEEVVGWRTAERGHLEAGGGGCADLASHSQVRDRRVDGQVQAQGVRWLPAISDGDDEEPSGPHCGGLPQPARTLLDPTSGSLDPAFVRIP